MGERTASRHIGSRTPTRDELAAKEQIGDLMRKTRNPLKSGNSETMSAQTLSFFTSQSTKHYLSTLDTGYLWLPELEFISRCIEKGIHNALIVILLRPPSNGPGTTMVCDLGLRTDWAELSSCICYEVEGGTRKIGVRKDVRDSVVG